MVLGVCGDRYVEVGRSYIKVWRLETDQGGYEEIRICWWKMSGLNEQGEVQDVPDTKNIQCFELSWVVVWLGSGRDPGGVHSKPKPGGVDGPRSLGSIIKTPNVA